MKRMIWAIVAGVVFMTGCQNLTISDYEKHLVKTIRDRECMLLIETIYLEHATFPENIESAELSRDQFSNYAQRIQMDKFVNGDRDQLNKVKLDIVLSFKSLYQLFLDTPTNEWYMSNEIKIAKRDIMRKKAEFIEQTFKICI